MVTYKIDICRDAEKELRVLPKEGLRRLVSKIQSLERNPRPTQATPLRGRKAYRLRQGSWRVVYEIDDALHVVTIIKIGHRREVYR